MASQYTPNIPGSTHDAQFWLLLNNLFTEGASVIDTALKVRDDVRRPNTQRFWLFSASTIGLLCNIAAIIVYFSASRGLSVGLSFWGAAAQTIVPTYKLLHFPLPEKSESELLLSAATISEEAP